MPDATIKSKAEPSKRTKPNLIAADAEKQNPPDHQAEQNPKIVVRDEAPLAKQAAEIDVKDNRVWLTEEKEASGQFDSL